MPLEHLRRRLLERLHEAAGLLRLQIGDVPRLEVEIVLRRSETRARGEQIAEIRRQPFADPEARRHRRCS